MARLNTERQKRLEPERIEYAVRKIQELGYEITHRDDLMIMGDGKDDTGRARIAETSKAVETWVNGE